MLFTCGHSTRTFDELTDLLQRHGITVLVDVRAIPRSRFYPHFNKSFFEKHLPMKYRWMGDSLGGKNADLIPRDVFEKGIEELMRISKEETVCIMCSEREPTPTKWRKTGCHRWFSIAPALQAKGADIVHI